MARNEWSPEPWRRGEEHELKVEIVDAKGCEVGRVHGRLFIEGGDAMEANFRRILACVNACAGIPTEALEAGGLQQVIGWLEDWKRDEPEKCPNGVYAALRALGRLE